MIQLPVLDLTKSEKRKRELPVQFNEEIREDLVKRAVLAIQSHKRQLYGASPLAGKRSSAKLSRRRRDYRGAYGLGISRVPRKILSRRGTRMNWVGAFAPGMRGGRKAHPPKSSKIFFQKINTKERRKALRSALAATTLTDMVKRRNHILPEIYPFILDNNFETIKRTKDLETYLYNLGLGKELERTDYLKIRAGKGKIRNRRYRGKVGPLIVVGANADLVKAGRNIPGLDIVEVRKLNVLLLAPGTQAGRLTIFTESALDLMEKEKLFTDK